MQEAQRAREEGERRRRERGYDRRYRDRYKDRYRRVCTIGITPFKFFMISFVSFGRLWLINWLCCIFCVFNGCSPSKASLQTWQKTFLKSRFYFCEDVIIIQWISSVVVSNQVFHWKLLAFFLNKVEFTTNWLMETLLSFNGIL